MATAHESGYLPNKWAGAATASLAQHCHKSVLSHKMMSHNNTGHAMMWWIDIDDAIRIYASMLRARLGSRRGAKAAQAMADHLRAKCDWSRGQSLGSSGR